MNGHRIGHLGGADDGRHVQVAVLRGGRADAHGFIGQQHVLLVEVGGGMHGDGFDAQLAARAQDAKRDFTAVGDNYFFEHGFLG